MNLALKLRRLLYIYRAAQELLIDWRYARSSKSPRRHVWAILLRRSPQGHLFLVYDFRSHMVIGWRFLQQGHRGPPGGLKEMVECLQLCSRQRGSPEALLALLLPSQRNPSSLSLLALEALAIDRVLSGITTLTLSYTLFRGIPLAGGGWRALAVLINYCNSYERHLLSGGVPPLLQFLRKAPHLTAQQLQDSIQGGVRNFNFGMAAPLPWSLGSLTARARRFLGRAALFYLVIPPCFWLYRLLISMVLSLFLGYFSPSVRRFAQLFQRKSPLGDYHGKVALYLRSRKGRTVRELCNSLRGFSHGQGG